ARNLKPVGLQPRRNRLYILFCGAKLLAEFLGSEPMVVKAGSTVLLLIEQILERGLLLSAAGQHQQHPLHRQIRRRKPAIKLAACQRMSVAGQPRQPAFINRPRDPGPNQLAARLCEYTSAQRARHCTAKQGALPERSHSDLTLVLQATDVVGSFLVTS